MVVVVSSSARETVKIELPCGEEHTLVVKWLFFKRKIKIKCKPCNDSAVNMNISFSNPTLK